MRPDFPVIHSLRRASSCLALAGSLLAIPVVAQRPAPAWTRGATCYEIFVRSFSDSDGDGIGDLKGLIAKLDYINDGTPGGRRSLGARCIWLMPIAESPSYHGYDVSDYYKVEPDYGTNDDFKQLVTEAHARGIKVLVDLVLNHSSREHPAFKAALSDTASPYRDWYRFASPKPAELGPWGQDVWVKSPVRDEYYYAVFSNHMPDLNFQAPAVREEAKKIARFWLEEMGVDGFRLDAVSYLVEENGVLQGAPGTHAALHEFADYVHGVRPDAFTVGEVYDTIGTVLTYYPDQLDSYFAFEVADSIISAVRAGSARGVLPPILRLQRSAPAGRYSPFLRNHDQPRTRTELGGNMAKAKVAALLMLTMPGIPFVYYGEEIGMIGAKPDERLRTPMQWSRAHAGGFTRGTPWQPLQSDSLTTTVAAQERDPASLLHLTRRLIHLREANPALAGGELIPLTASHDAVASYIRRDGDRLVLVVANLSAKTLRGVTIASAEGALPAGRWALRNLLGGSAALPLRTGADGTLAGYVPLRTLAPRRGYLFELVPAPARAAR